MIEHLRINKPQKVDICNIIAARLDNITLNKITLAKYVIRLVQNLNSRK